LLVDVVHELRTPLTVIVGHAQVLRGSPHLPAPLYGPVTGIEKSALQMQVALDDLARRWNPRRRGPT
jgi:signal transduction histidine kinase